MSIERWVLPNGLIVLYRENRSIPLVAATLLVRTGSYDDRRSKAGLANLAVELWTQGTRRRSSRQIADVIESIGGSLGAQSSDDHLEMGWVVPAAHWLNGLEVVADIVLNASFPSEEIVKERAHVLASLRSRNDTIFTVAHDHFNAALYKGHPYGIPTEGFPETVKKLTRKDLAAWQKAQIRPDRSILSIVAPFPARTVLTSVQRLFKGWQRPPEPHPEPTCSLRPHTSNNPIRVRASFQQAYLMTGVPAPAAGDSDYLVLKVLNTILGGGMSSRLFLKLREELGLAYEVASFFPTRIRTSQWVIYLGLPVDKLKMAQQKLQGILHQLMRYGVTPAEMKQSKQMIKAAYVMEHQTRRRQAWYTAWWEFLGNGPQFDETFPQAIDAVSLDAVGTLAKQLLSQPRVTVEVIPK